MNSIAAVICNLTMPVLGTRIISHPSSCIFQKMLENKQKKNKGKCKLLLGPLSYFSDLMFPVP